MAVIIQVRRDTEISWSTINPILAQGEFGENLNNGLVKLGDGIRHWLSLDYYGATVSGIIAHDLLAGLNDDDHVQYLNEFRADERYYTQVELDNGQLDNRYYNETEINTISGVINSKIITHHSGLSGLSNDDHPQYHTDARGDIRYYGKTAVDSLITSTSGSIIKDHGGLTGLSDDDHSQYHTDARGDIRYYGKTAVDNLITSTSGSIIKAHSGLTGLGNDEHTQYILANGTRAFTSTVSGVIPTQPNHLVTKGYTDAGLTAVSGSIIKGHGGLTGLSNDDHPQYHTDARGDIRYYGKTAVDNLITSTSGSIIKAHSGLTGLGNDEHTQYILANGTRAFTSTVSGVIPTQPNHLVTKGYTDAGLTAVSGSIIKGHGGLTGLSNDDHPQYHTDARGDIRYYTKTLVDNMVTSTSGSIIKAHSGLTGLGNDDHTHYTLSNGTRAFTSTVLGVTPTQPGHLATKGYVDTWLTTVSGNIIKSHGELTGLSNDDHAQYIKKDGTRQLSSDWNYGNSSISGTGNFYGNGSTLSNVGYVENGDIYFYDSTRNKDLGVGIIQIGCGRNSMNTTNQYIRMYDSIVMNLSGVTLPFDSTLVGMTMSEQVNTQSWTAQVRKNDSDTVLDSLSIVNAYENHTWNKNTDFVAGDRVQVYLNGTNIKYPQVMLYFRRKK